MWQDLRHAFRQLRRTPALTAVKILTLVLGIGLNLAVFSIVRAVLLRPLPFADPDRVVAIWSDGTQPLATPARWDRPEPGPTLIEWRASSGAFADLAGVLLWRHNLDSRIDLIAGDGAERLRGGLATPNFFTMLGVGAALGRTFSEADAATPGATPAVISDALWRRRFASDPSVIGRTVRALAGRPRAGRALTIIGVLPASFRFTYPEETEVWVLQPWDVVARAPRGAGIYQVLGRLKPDVAPEQAAADLHRLELAAAKRESYRARMVTRVEPFARVLSTSSRPLIVTLAAVGVFVLMIACVNVMQLLLAGAIRRARDVATRVALGATTRHLLRQAFAEALVIGTVATVAAAASVAVALPAVRRVVPGIIPRAGEAALDAQTLAVCVASGALAVILGCVVSVLLGAGRDPLTWTRHGGAGGAASPRARAWRRITIAVQVAAVFVLVAGAGLLLRSFWRLTHVDLGFDGTQVLTMEIRVLHDRLRDDAKDTQRLREFERAVMERVSAIPGVRDAAMTSAVPLRGTDWSYRFAVVDPAPGGTRDSAANGRQVTPEYFQLMRIPLREGRLFTNADDAHTPRRVIVSQSLARMIAPNGSAVGRHLALESPAEIIGVVGDVRSASVATAPSPALYFARAQTPSELACLVIRTAEDQTTSVASTVRAAIHEIDPQQPIERVTTLDDVVTESIADRWFYAVATASFGAIGLLLALCGLAGVVAASVSERVREMAIRIALGARAATVQWMIVREALGPVLAGIGAGALASWWLTRLLQSELFEITPHDPLTFVAGAAGLIGCGALAAYFPARAATRVDPMVALRAE